MDMTKSVDALVFGGGSSETIDGTVTPKGLLNILDKPMVEWVINALKSAESVDRVALVFPDLSLLPDSIKNKVDLLIESNAEFADNVLAGLDALGSSRPILATTGDIPALSGEAVDDLVRRTKEAGADFAYAVIAADVIEEQFPGSVRTYLDLRDGKITGGNIIVLGPKSLAKMREYIQVFFEARKNPMQTARVLGMSFMTRFALGRLSFADIERKMCKILNANCRAIMTPYASIGADVDKAVDKEVVERFLSSNLQH